jgi:hypothetical protein
VCITRVIEECEGIKTTWPLTHFGYQKCIHKGYNQCLRTLKPYGYPRRFKDFVYKTCKRVRHSRRRPYYRRSVQRVTCLLKCYEEHFKEFSDAIYIQIP